MGNLAILETNFDTLKIERCYIGGTDEAPEALAVVSGVLCTIETSAAYLREGLAWCEPRAEREDWPVYTDVVRSDGYRRLDNVTTEPRLVAAARRFAELERAGQLRVGIDLEAPNANLGKNPAR